MQDFYIQQRTQQQLTSDQIQRWYLTVNMLGPDNIIGDEFILASQEGDLLYIIPLVRHLTAQEAERIVEGYMRITDHDFEIETSNVYRADADFMDPWDFEIVMDEGAKSTIEESYIRQAHNEWIQEMISKGYRYGLNMSADQKTHPAMRPWDDLPSTYQRMPHIDERKLLNYYSQNISKFS